MLYAQLAAREAVIRQSGLSSTYSLKPFAIQVPAEDLLLNAVLCTPQSRSGYYHNIEHAKVRIVLHFTAGQLGGDLESLTKQNHRVSVPFVIARDGTIYQLYLSKFWSGNLGAEAVGNKGTNNAQDKCTIGIELSNYGPLYEKNGLLYTVYDTPYCTLADKTAYQNLSTPFRGASYFATFTEPQYTSLTILLRYLTVQHKIPRQFVPEPTRYETFEGVTNVRGIVTHVNYRPSGKWDIGPAFDWNRLIRDVQAPVFAVPASRDADLFSEHPIQSEDALLPLLSLPASASLESEAYEEKSSIIGTLK